MAWVKMGGAGGPIQKWTAAGQRVEGVFLGLRDGKEFRAGQGKSKLVDIKQQDGTQVTFGAPTALASQLSQVQPGTGLRIKYLGMARGQSGVEYKNFETEAYVAEAEVPPVPVRVQQALSSTQQPGPKASGEFERLTGILVAAKGSDAGNAIADAIASMDGDPVERMKKTLTAQGVAF